MTSLLLYRDNAAKRPKPASASAASEYLNLPEYIRKAKNYPFFEFEAAVKEGERYCDLNTLCASANVSLTDKDAENASGFIELCTGSRSNFEKLVKQWEELEGPFCTTPDVWISDGGDDNDSVVILVAEVHSGEGPEGYRNTLNKEVIGLMTQLRMLRYQYDINQVVGFVLSNSSEPFFVTKVTCGLRGFTFTIHLKGYHLWKMWKQVLGLDIKPTRMLLVDLDPLSILVIFLHIPSN